MNKSQATKSYRALSLRKLPEGGYVVYEPPPETGMAAVDLCASLKLEKALAFMKARMEQNHE